MSLCTCTYTHAWWQVAWVLGVSSPWGLKWPGCRKLRTIALYKKMLKKKKSLSLEALAYWPQQGCMYNKENTSLQRPVVPAVSNFFAILV